jgi:hypothetical protein
MPKKGKFKRQKMVNPEPEAINKSGNSSKSLPATTPRKIVIAGASSTLNEHRIAQRVSMHRSAISDVKLSLVIGTIIFALLIVIYVILKGTHFFGIS